MLLQNLTTTASNVEVGSPLDCDPVDSASKRASGARFCFLSFPRLLESSSAGRKRVGLGNRSANSRRRRLSVRHHQLAAPGELRVMKVPVDLVWFL